MPGYDKIKTGWKRTEKGGKYWGEAGTGRKRRSRPENHFAAKSSFSKTWGLLRLVMTTRWLLAPVRMILP